MAEYNWYNWPENNFKHELSPAPSHPQKCQNALDILRTKLQESQLIRGQIQTDDEHLQRFLNAKKCHIANTLALVQHYYDFKQRHCELFQFTDGAKQALTDGFPSVLKNRDRHGRCILVYNAINWNTSQYTLLHIGQALIVTLDQLTQIGHNQLCGFVVIVDWSEFTMTQSASLNPRVLKMLVQCLEDCYPAKFKGVHFIGQPWYVATALTVIKPFLKTKTRQRIHLHGNNLATLHEHVTVDVLPSELGGEGPPLDTISWAAQLLDKSVNY